MAKQKFISAKEVKQGTVQSLAEKISRSKTLAFADYRGLTVNQISQLRNKVKEAGGEMIVTKNSLILRALQSAQFKVHSSKFTGPTAAVFAYDDEIAPIKAVAESAKTTGIPSFKFGFFQKSLLDGSGLEQLATIPSKLELHAKVVGALSSPLYTLASVLQANIRNLVSVLDQLSKKGA